MFFPITLLLALGTVLQASAMPTTAALAARDDDDVAIMFGRSINNDSIVWAHHNGSCSAFFLASAGINPCGVTRQFTINELGLGDVHGLNFDGCINECGGWDKPSQISRNGTLWASCTVFAGEPDENCGTTTLAKCMPVPPQQGMR